MKTLIWAGCLLCGSMTQVLLGYAGITGALPVAAIYTAVYASARSLCKRYEERQQEKMEAAPPHPTEAEPPAKETDLPPARYCRKCGQKLIQDSAFCSYCGTAVKDENT